MSITTATLYAIALASVPFCIYVAVRFIPVHRDRSRIVWTDRPSWAVGIGSASLLLGACAVGALTVPGLILTILWVWSTLLVRWVSGRVGAAR